MLWPAEIDFATWLAPAIPYAIPAMLVAWFFWLGGCIGSFLNVVIYRVPAGLNLFYPPSRCPVCLHPIRLGDNVPILGWIRLGGRCRDCKTPISSRYPVVEAILAATFAIVAGVEIVADRPLMDLSDGRADLSMTALWVGGLLHLGWLATAFSAGMIRRDGKAVTPGLWAPILLAAIAAIGWEPRLQTIVASQFAPFEGADRLIAIFFGGAIAVVFAFVAGFPSDGRRDQPISWGAAALGFALGWHAAVVSIVLAMTAQIAMQLIARATDAKRPLGQTLVWYVAVVALLTIGPWFGEFWRSLDDIQDWVLWISFAVALLAGRIVLHFLADSVPTEPSDETVRDANSGFAEQSKLADPTSPETKSSDSLMDELQPGADQPIDDADAVGRDGIDLPGEPTEAEPAPAATTANGAFPPDPPPRVTITTEQERANLEAILESPSYRVAYKDLDFLHSAALRPVRLQLELLKVETAMIEEGINSTVVVFGGTQVVERAEAERRLAAARAAIEKAPDDFLAKRELIKAERILAKSRYYDEAREFGRLVSASYQADARQKEYVVITGGGPGIMEAANRGAMDVGAKSIGLNIALPEEQHPNPYITPELCFRFHYFALRKMHFLLRAKALVVFPGGYGTFDELFEVLTLRQTGRMQPIPIILVGREYWEHAVDFQYLADEGVIRDAHLELMEFADSALDAWKIIQDFHATPPEF